MPVASTREEWFAVCWRPIVFLVLRTSGDFWSFWALLSKAFLGLFVYFSKQIQVLERLGTSGLELGFDSQRSCGFPVGEWCNGSFFVSWIHNVETNKKQQNINRTTNFNQKNSKSKEFKTTKTSKNATSEDRKRFRGLW